MGRCPARSGRANGFLTTGIFDGLVKNLKNPSSVIPAQAGIQYFKVVRILWIPVPRFIPSRTSFTGMTTFYDSIIFDLFQKEVMGLEKT